MEWLGQGAIWHVLLPAVFVLGWGLTEVRARRRLTRFGDPRCMGIAARWGPRITGALILALALGAIAKILAAGEAPPASDSVPLTELLLDSEAFDGSNPVSERHWNNLEGIVHQVASADPVSLVSLFRSGEGIEMVIPPTRDVQGVLILLDRLRFLWEEPMTAPLEMSIEALARSDAADEEPWRLLVFTARPAEEMASLGNSIPRSALDRLMVIRLPTVASPLQFGRYAADGKWDWSHEPQDLRAFLQMRHGEPASGQAGFAPWLSPIQYLALIAFVCLLSESLAVFWPSSVER